MDIERLNRIEEIHYAALNLPAAERTAFLRAACEGDDELLDEVESLLAFADEPASFLDSPPESLAAEMFAERRSGPDLTGREISHYNIIELLGTGGMGEVYLAQDTKLRRKVALKILPPQFSSDGERKNRFEKEARAVSALNHPNIITIYEIGEADGISFMATEFIDGHTLRHRMSEQRLSWQETVRLAIQVAGALESAHLVGIIHRDIKPANIMVRKDGIVKVLDFGLAKLTTRDKADLDTREHTAPHRVMGTINYMSPEQALGERIDTRTDIFSFGVVLYEMLTGEVPFSGSSDAAVYNATINKVLPSVCEADPTLPASLDQIVGRALQKERAARYSTFADLRADLKRLTRDSQTDSHYEAFTSRTAHRTAPDNDAPWGTTNTKAAAQNSARPPSLAMRLVRRWALPALAFLLIASGGALYFRYMAADGPRARLATPRTVPFTTFAGTADQPAFSPDGKQIAFVWDGEDGKNLDIYVKLVGAGSPLRLTTDPGQDIGPAWSPDGRYLAFIRRTEKENAIIIVPALGGVERKLGRTEPSISSQAWSECRLSWSPDGTSLAVADRASPDERIGIFLISVENGEKRRLTTPPAGSGDIAPAFSQDGHSLAFVRNADFSSGDIYVTGLDGEDLRRLTTDGQRVRSIAWTADGGGIVFSSNRGGGYGLWRVALNRGALEPVGGTGQNAFSPAVSKQGDLLVYNVSSFDADIWRADGPAAGRHTSPAKLIASSRPEHSPQYSPDGHRLVFVSDRSGSDELWVSGADGSNPAQLTYFNGTDLGSPRWSPDSRQIVFDARPNGNGDIFTVNADGGKPRAIVFDPSHDVMASWSRDSASIYFCSNRSGEFQVWKTPASGGEPVQVTQQGGFEALESPAGDLIYYTKQRGPGSIWQVSVVGGEEKQVSPLVNIGFWRYWTVMQDGICFVSAPITGGPVFSFFSFASGKVSTIGSAGQEPLLGLPGLTVSPDGRSIVYAQAAHSTGDLMLIENFH